MLHQAQDNETYSKIKGTEKLQVNSTLINSKTTA